MSRSSASISPLRSGTWGVLQLKLRRNSYNWKFLPIAGQSFEDAGKGYCHGKPK